MECISAGVQIMISEGLQIEMVRSGGIDVGDRVNRP
jgi:hypothetical protein